MNNGRGSDLLDIAASLTDKALGWGMPPDHGDESPIRVDAPADPGQGSAEPAARALQYHTRDLLKLLTVPPADLLSEAPCPICDSRDRWEWLDGRALCRVCLVLDLEAKLWTLLRQGCPDHAKRRRRRG